MTRPAGRCCGRLIGLILGAFAPGLAPALEVTLDQLPIRTGADELGASGLDLAGLVRVGELGTELLVARDGQLSTAPGDEPVGGREQLGGA